MRIELDNYIDYDDVVDFFTIRGRPLELEETLKKIPITKTIDSRVTHDYRKSKT